MSGAELAWRYGWGGSRANSRYRFGRKLLAGNTKSTQQRDGQGKHVREWQYWTRNKLEILAGYLPAFNVAAKRSEERLYIDLMAGEPVNREKITGEKVTPMKGRKWH